MSESNRRRFFAPFDQMPERCEPINHDGRIIGHGQQLAAERLFDRFRETAARVAPAVVGRQQTRRIVKKATKQAAARLASEQDKAKLEAMRKARQPWQCPKKHRGNLLTSRRQFKKPRGKAGWRVRDLGLMEQFERLGMTFPDTHEVTFHTTKGLRVVRTAAA